MAVDEELRALHALGDQVDAATEELVNLWPRLAGALERDRGGLGGERVTTSIEAALPVNADVLAAIEELHRQVWPVAWRARDALGEPGQMISMIDALRSLGILYRRLVGRRMDGHARSLACEVFDWRHLVRRAVGLTRPSRPLTDNCGRVMYCPLHDEPLAALRQPGDEGTLRQSHRPGVDEAITWRAGEGVYCPHCDARWTPAQYGLLGRLVAEADQRRTAVGSTVPGSEET